MKSWLGVVLIVSFFSGIPRAQSPDQAVPSAAVSAPAMLPLGVADEQAAVRNKLSTLWLCVSLNMIGADVLASYIPGSQENVIDYAGGKDEVKYFMLAGAIIYEIPISMIFLSKYLPYSANRWTNVGMAALSEFFILGGGSLEPHYVFAATMETAALAYIVWTALKWPDPRSAAGRKHDLGLRLNPGGDGAGLTYAYHF